MDRLSYVTFHSCCGIICSGMTKCHNHEKSHDFGKYRLQGMVYAPSNLLGGVSFVLYVTYDLRLRHGSAVSAVTLDSGHGSICSSMTKSQNHKHKDKKSHDFGKYQPQGMVYVPSNLLGGVSFVLYVT